MVQGATPALLWTSTIGGSVFRITMVQRLTGQVSQWESRTMPQFAPDSKYLKTVDGNVTMVDNGGREVWVVEYVSPGSAPSSL